MSGVWLVELNQMLPSFLSSGQKKILSVLKHWYLTMAAKIAHFYQKSKYICKSACLENTTLQRDLN